MGDLALHRRRTPVTAPRYADDAEDLTGALQLLQLLAQTIAPSVSLSNQALSDILYGQDQLPSTLTGPNNALAIFQAQQAGTGTESLSDYVSQQQGRLSELESILNGFLASAQQTAAGGQAAARPAGPPARPTAPKAGDLATANAPVLTYSVLAQLATGAKLDTDTVTVTSPGPLTSGLGTTRGPAAVGDLDARGRRSPPGRRPACRRAWRSAPRPARSPASRPRPARSRSPSRPPTRSGPRCTTRGRSPSPGP